MLNQFLQGKGKTIFIRDNENGRNNIDLEFSQIYYLATEVSRKRRERRGRGFHCCLGGSGIRRPETAGRPIVTNSWFSVAVASMRGEGESGRGARVRGGI